VLIPSGSAQPQPYLTLEEMDVKIEIDEGFSRTSLRQLFRNRTHGDLEGTYEFFIPESAAISQFAIWEDGVRLPGVVLEKKRAEQLYEQIVSRRRDPGLLRQAEEERRNVFSAKVFPIPALGTKRIEIQYTEELPVTGLVSHYLLGLKPERYRVQKAGFFTLEFILRSQLPVSRCAVRTPSIPLKLNTETPTCIRGSFSAKEFSLDQDVSVTWRYDVPVCHLSFLSYRDPDRAHRIVPLFSKGRPVPDTDGYFLAKAYTNLTAATPEHERPGKTVVVLCDLSLSMRWEKLDRAWEFLDGFLHALGPKDRFLLLTFSDRLNAFPADRAAAPAARADEALAWLGTQYQAGGTDLLAAFRAGIETAARYAGEGACAVVAITDGHPTAREVSYGRILEQVVSAARGAGIPLHIFGVGDDANAPLLAQIAQGTDSAFFWARDTEDISYKLSAFLERMSDAVLTGALFSLDAAVNRVYPAGPQKFFDRSSIHFVGRYTKPQEKAKATFAFSHAGKKTIFSDTFFLPAKDTSHPDVPRVWAKARVDDLLRLIRTEGEREEWIEEVISLSKQYNFVTPYTAFLAAPRALLRPRTMKPGDPILRVKASPDIIRVVAVFPFGLIKPLAYDDSQGVWETRFLAPAGMRDGAYECTLILTDAHGRVMEDKKSFVIDSRPPSVRVFAGSGRVKPGQEIELVAYADSDTRSIRARIAGSAAVNLNYDSGRKASVGTLRIPPGLPSGRYEIQVTAEDFAHNCTLVSVPVEVRGL